MTQLELYTRGLALADGHAPKGRTHLVFHMSTAARPVLEKIAAHWSLSGIRPQKQGTLKVLLPGKGSWKTDLKGLDMEHAFRGFVEGDGCWTRESTSTTYKGRTTRYIYPVLKILVQVRETELNRWVGSCLSYWNVQHSLQTRLQPGRTEKLFVYAVRRDACVRLHRILYQASEVDFKRLCLKSREAVTICGVKQVEPQRGEIVTRK